jgi:uncharacterized protein
VRISEVGRFFGLVLILSLPFYALGVAGHALPFAPALPISALMANVPMIAALGLIIWQRGSAAVGTLFKSALALHRIPIAWWALLSLCIMPAAFALTGGIIWLSGTALPTLHLLPLSAILPAFALFLLVAVAEEIGWQGYAYPRLTLRYSALQAAPIIGVVWALWHIIPFAVMGRGATWIIWHSSGMVCMRIIIVWLFVNTGQSIAVAVLFHMVSNSVWGLFINFDPWYDPLFMCVVLLIAVAAIIWTSKYDQRILGVTGPGTQRTFQL